MQGKFLECSRKGSREGETDTWETLQVRIWFVRPQYVKTPVYSYRPHWYSTLAFNRHVVHASCARLPLHVRRSWASVPSQWPIGNGVFKSIMLYSLYWALGKAGIPTPLPLKQTSQSFLCTKSRTSQRSLIKWSTALCTASFGKKPFLQSKFQTNNSKTVTVSLLQ